MTEKSDPPGKYLELTCKGSEAETEPADAVTGRI